MNKSNQLLSLISGKQPMTFRQQFQLTVLLSVPAILSQLSTIAMEYIDATMVGSLGKQASASIGLVFTSTWLFWGLCTTFVAGFSVQVAHALGASHPHRARTILRQSIVTTGLFSLLLMLLGVAISKQLPGWLGADESIRKDAYRYFLIFILSLPALQMNFLSGSMLRSSGNMLVPGLLNVLMCLLDVVFNFMLIYPSRELHLFGQAVWMPGAGLGVTGAALGTLLSYYFVAAFQMWYLCFKDKNLSIYKEKGAFLPTLHLLKKAVRISLPMTVEHAVICGAQIFVTVIVTPLGLASIAANSFAVTAESLCYMPGFGIADAATTLVGQSIGAERRDLARRFAFMTVFLGMLVMSVMGLIMYLTAPQIMEIMSPVREISELGSMALRIEAFAEPMFAAAIIAYGVFVGAGDTLVPSIMNFSSIWLVRIPLAAWLAPQYGLRGVWLAMCIELCFRGTIFLLRLFKGTFLKKNALA